MRGPLKRSVDKTPPAKSPAESMMAMFSALRSHRSSKTLAAPPSPEECTVPFQASFTASIEIGPDGRTGSFVGSLIVRAVESLAVGVRSVQAFNAGLGQMMMRKILAEDVREIMIVNLIGFGTDLCGGKGPG